MLYKLILLQFIAHLFADFIFQPHRWSLQKKSKSISWHHIYHGFFVFIFSWILSLNFNYWIFALILTALHFILDCLKSSLQIRLDKENISFNLFFADQFVHFLIIILIPVFYNYYFRIDFLFEIPVQYIEIILCFVACTKPANIAIKNILMIFSIDIPDENDEPVNNHELENYDKSIPNAGKIIGISERFLVLALVLVGQLGSIGLILAAKSILRFKSTQKNEYILAGTILSFAFAAILGILFLKE